MFNELIKIRIQGRVILVAFLMSVSITSCEYFSNDKEPEIIGTGKTDELMTFLNNIKYLKKNDLINKGFISITSTIDNGFVHCTNYKGDNENRDADIIILKRNSDGNKIWEYVFSKQGNHVVNVGQLEGLDDGSILLSGGIKFSDHITHLFLLKLSIDGKFLWERTYPINCSSNIHGMNLTNDGGFIIYGIKLENGDKGFVIKTDEDGNLEWENTYGEEGARAEAISIMQYEAGYFLSIKTSDKVLKYSLHKRGEIAHRNHKTDNSSFNYIIKANDFGFIFLNKYYNRSTETDGIELKKLDDKGKTIWQMDLIKNSDSEIYYKTIKPIQNSGYFVIYEKDSKLIVNVINNSGELIEY